MAQQYPISPYSLDEDIATEDALCDVEIAMEAMFEHSCMCHQAHVHCAEAHYWAVDHASHVAAYYEMAIPF